MYKYIEIGQNILIQCDGNYMEMKKFNYILAIDILGNCSQKIGCPEGCFCKGLGLWGVEKTPRLPAG